MSSDAPEAWQDTPPARLPESLRRLVTPWWETRADRLAALLETAANAGVPMVELDGEIITVEHLTDMAQYAIEMVEALDIAEKSRGETCT